MIELNQTYYDILKIKPGASKEEIKSAFRKRAKELHPDRNKAPDAHEQFILLNEAYDKLTNPVVRRTRTTASRDKNRDYVRRQAQYYAKKRYDEFVNSDYYKEMNSLNNVVDFIYFWASVLLVVCIPVFLTLSHGITGLFIGVLILTVSGLLILGGLKNAVLVSRKEFVDSLIYVLTRKRFQMVLLILMSAVLLFRYGLNTLIRPLTMAIFIVAIPVLVNFLMKRAKKPSVKAWSNLLAFGIIPSTFLILLTLNYYITVGSETETYSYKGANLPGENTDTYIILDNQQYSEFPQIRVFGNNANIPFNNRVTYQFETGFLGIRVLKDYELTYR